MNPPRKHHPHIAQHRRVRPLNPRPDHHSTHHIAPHPLCITRILPRPPLSRVTPLPPTRRIDCRVVRTASSLATPNDWRRCSCTNSHASHNHPHISRQGARVSLEVLRRPYRMLLRGANGIVSKLLGIARADSLLYRRAGIEGRLKLSSALRDGVPCSVANGTRRNRDSGEVSLAIERERGAARNGAAGFSWHRM